MFIIYFTLKIEGRKAKKALISIAFNFSFLCAQTIMFFILDNLFNNFKGYRLFLQHAQDWNEQFSTLWSQSKDSKNMTQQTENYGKTRKKRGKGNVNSPSKS